MSEIESEQGMVTEDSETDSGVVHGTPRKRRVSDRFDLKNDFDQWMTAQKVSLVTRKKYICALSKYLGTINIRAVTAKLSNVSNYLKTLETVGGRRTLFLGYLKLVDFLRIQMNLAIEPFEWPSTSDYIDLYLKSEERKDLYHNFTNISKAMELGWSASEIHDFLMGEVLLCSKEGKGFLYNITLDDFLKVKSPDARGFWEYTGKTFSVKFPDRLKEMLKSYAFIVRPRLVKGRKSHDVKLFELFDRRGVPYPRCGSLFKYVEDFSKSLVQIKFENVLEAQFKFSWFKWEDFVGEIKGYNGKGKEVSFTESDEEEEEMDAEESIGEPMAMDIDHSLMEKHVPSNVCGEPSIDVPSPKPQSPGPSTSEERPRRSQGTLNFSEKELKQLKSFFQKYKPCDMNEQTVMVVLQFEDGVEDLLESKRSASGMGDKQFWKALAYIIRENL